MLRFALFLSFMLCATAAHALTPKKSTLVRAIEYGLSTHAIDPDTGALLGRAECAALEARTADVTFVFGLTADAPGRLVDAWLFELSPTAGAIACDESECLPLEDVATDGQDITVSVDPQTLLQGSGCESDRDVFVRIDLLKQLDEDDITSADARLRLDVTPPGARAIETVDATDNFVEVTLEAVSASEDAERWHVGWIVAGAAADGPDQLTRLGSVTGAARTATFDDVELAAGVPIDVYVWGEDAAGNEGALSAPFEVEPVDAIDFWEAHGHDDASCASASGSTSLLGLLVVLAVVLVRRRRVLIASVVSLLVPAAAAAEVGVVNARIGTYSPVVLREPEFSRYFGEQSRWMVGADGSWMFAQSSLGGGLGVDGGLSYTRMRGASFAGERTYADGSSLTLFPARLGLRALSGTWSRWFALSVQAGLLAVPFRFGNPGGTSVSSDGAVGRGVQWGWATSAQLAINLTGFDRESAAKLESGYAIRRTLLFVEGDYSRADDFGRSSIDFGATQLNVGLGFTF